MVSDVPFGEGRAVRVGERRIAIFNSESGWFALDDRCPHRGGPLSDGILSACSVICPLHGRRFDLASGSELGGALRAASHPVGVVDDEVHLEIEAPDTQPSR